ncbi:Tripartite ATP-independent transporter DctM subunit OS=Castellaniella defragrans OX=75697 GN=HNR28_001847 PE=4 SV=1 [Castellaniella defragrans]
MSGQAPVIALAQNMVDGSTSSFILLALPFFIFVGLIMERGGISTKLVAWAMAMVGHLRGGILQVMVVTTYLVAGISGSKTADVAAVGSVMRAELVKRGYRQEEGAAVLSAATAMSETIPPSIGMLVLGSVTPISIGTLFLAGIIPAAVVALCIMLAIYLITRLRGERPGTRASGRVMVASAIRAIPAMIMPAIMIIGIRAGIATPTEVSAVAAFYGVLLAVVIYRAIGWKEFCKVTAESAVISGMVLFIIAAAFAFSWALSAAYLPQQLVSFVHGTSKAVFLIESIFFLIIIGSLLEGLPALIILGPLLLPLATELGVGSVHYAILLLLAMGVGIFMPPLGVGFYVATAVLESKLEPAAKAMLPFLGVLLVGILLVAFVPWFTNVLPSLFE